MSGNTAVKSESILPNNVEHWLQLRARDITSTESPALFGLSPYMTEFELWHRKNDAAIVEIQQNDRMKWGTRLQDSIAKGIAEDEGWLIRRMDEYMRIDHLRMGSSFDYEIGRNEGILEVKNVDSLAFKEGWLVEEDQIEAPPHIEIQVQHQLAVSGFPKAYIGALVGGNRVVLLERTPDPKVIDMIKIKISNFWRSIDQKAPPAPDFLKDAEFISQLYRYAEPGKLFDAREFSKIQDLSVDHRNLGEDLRKITSKRDAIKAEILTIIGDAEKVMGDGFTISCSTVSGARIEYDREPYRGFRIHWKKEKR